MRSPPPCLGEKVKLFCVSSNLKGRGYIPAAPANSSAEVWEGRQERHGPPPVPLCVVCGDYFASAFFLWPALLVLLGAAGVEAGRSAEAMTSPSGVLTVLAEEAHPDLTAEGLSRTTPSSAAGLGHGGGVRFLSTPSE